MQIIPNNDEEDPIPFLDKVIRFFKIFSMKNNGKDNKELIIENKVRGNEDFNNFETPNRL